MIPMNKKATLSGGAGGGGQVLLVKKEMTLF